MFKRQIGQWRPSTKSNAAEAVQEELKTVTGSSTHEDVSARVVARRTGIPYTTLWLALKPTLRWYPYRIHGYHKLLPYDLVKRKAVWAFQKMSEDDDWLHNGLWTDEAHFTLRGSVHSPNCRILATENPRTVMQDEKVLVWVRLNTSTVIGPFSSRKCVILVL